MPKITVLCADAFIHGTLQCDLYQSEDIALIDVPMWSEQQLLECARAMQPDLLLLDGDSDYLTLLTSVRLLSPGARAIIFYDFFGHREVIEAISRGARGCLEKTSDPSGWEKAIRVVHEGHVWLNRQLLVESLDWMLRHNQDKGLLNESKPKRLTAREWEIVHWVSQGMTNKEIAKQLDISDTTVKTHLQHVFSKLAVRRRLQLPIA